MTIRLNICSSREEMMIGDMVKELKPALGELTVIFETGKNDVVSLL